jgi:hypothetical protein
MSSIITGGITIYEYGTIIPISGAPSTYGDLSIGSNVITGVPTGSGEFDYVREGQIV